jgi:hypothetical protein
MQAAYSRNIGNGFDIKRENWNHYSEVGADGTAG